MRRGGRGLGLALREERVRLGHRQVEHLGDVEAAEPQLEHLRLEPLATAVLAQRRDGLHEAELGVDHPVAVAGLAGALGVGGEQRRLHAVGLRERLADRIEQPGVRRRVAAPRALDRRLVDRPRTLGSRRAIEPVDQRALARPGDAGHHAQHAERDVDVDVLQVVGARAADLDLAGRGSAPPP